MCSGSAPSYKPKPKPEELPPQAPPEAVDITLGESEDATKKKKKRKALGSQSLAIPLTAAKTGGLGGLGI